MMFSIFSAIFFSVILNTLILEFFSTKVKANSAALIFSFLLMTRRILFAISLASNTDFLTNSMGNELFRITKSTVDPKVSISNDSALSP